jgi:Tn3 transposase DDE domain/N-6 DNA Methylase
MLEIAMHDIQQDNEIMERLTAGAFRFCDPTCGSFGFGSVALSHIESVVEHLGGMSDGQKAKLKHTLRATAFTGADAAPRMVMLARVNMALQGAPKAKIFYTDSSLTTKAFKPNSFDLICTNPPFGTPKFTSDKKGKESKERYEAQMEQVLGGFRSTEPGQLALEFFGRHLMHPEIARHGSKYFGLKKGVSAYTLVANHVPCNARIIGTHEHESHFVFDILHNNTTDIQPERHSTDTHGTNQANFWLLFFDGYQFAPRYRDLHKRMSGLVGFRHPNHHADRLIKPVRKTFDLDHQGVAEHPAHHGISCAKGRDPGNGRTQAEFLRPTKPDQESPLGVGQHPTDHLHPRFHR